MKRIKSIDELIRIWDANETVEIFVSYFPSCPPFVGVGEHPNRITYSIDPLFVGDFLYNKKGKYHIFVATKDVVFSKNKFS